MLDSFIQTINVPKEQCTKVGTAGENLGAGTLELCMRRSLLIQAEKRTKRTYHKTKGPWKHPAQLASLPLPVLPP